MPGDDLNRELEALYNAVLHSLNKGDCLSDIDTDSLIEVYDYAYDISDEFVCSEVLADVLNRVPDCKPMLERKAIRYLQQSEINGALCMAARLPLNSFVRKLVFAHSTWSGQDWRACYDRLLRGTKRGAIDDFGALALIDFALGVDSIQHLAQLLDTITPLIRYPREFYADLADSLIDNAFYEDAVNVLQELTVIEPFNIDNWLKLADLYSNQTEQLDNAGSAIDYALAIEPENPLANLLYGSLLVKEGRQLEVVYEIADRLIASGEHKADAIYLKAGAYIKQNENAKAVSCLLEYVDESPNPLDVFILIHSLCNGDLPAFAKIKLRDVISESEPEDFDRFIKTGADVLDNVCFQSLMDVVVDSGKSVSNDLVPLVMQHMYLRRQYKRLINLFNRTYGDSVDIKTGVIYAFARLRTGYIEGLELYLCEMMASVVGAASNGAPIDRFLRNPLIKCAGDLVRICKRASECGLTDELISEIDSIDPFFD